MTGSRRRQRKYRETLDSQIERTGGGSESLKGRCWMTPPTLQKMLENSVPMTEFRLGYRMLTVATTGTGYPHV